MGLITQTITFTQGLVPTAAQWQAQDDAVYNLVNGQLDSANVDKTSADGIMVLDTAQTRTGTLTHNADIIIGNTYGVIIGDATQVASGGVTAEMQVVGTAGADSTLMVGRWSADASGPALHFLKSRHATIGSFTVVADNDVLGEIVWTPADGGDAASAGAKIFARIDGTPGTDDFPTELVFATTADAGNSVTERIAITPAGNLVPITNDGVALGTTTLGFSDLHLAAGGVINWANGEITITETDANTLTIAGVATRFDFAAGILEMNNAVEWDTGVAVVATEYSVGRDADATNQLHFNVPTGATFEWSVNDVSGMVLTGGPILFLNDTANADQTIGMTINQGANDNTIFACKSSDVAHGMTNNVETDTYFQISKQSAANGGGKLDGISAVTTGLYILSAHVTDDATRSTAAVGHTMFQASTKSGAGWAAVAADKNTYVFRNHGNATHILDSDGDSHQDVGTAWTNFDDYDDVALLDALSVAVSREGDPIRRDFGSFLKENRETLDKLPGKKIVQFNDDGHHFVNMSRLAMLHTGAIRQVYQKVIEQAKEIEFLKKKLALLPERN